MIDILQKLDPPKWFAVFFGGVLIGAGVTSTITSNFYEKGRLPSLEEQLQECKMNATVLAQNAKQNLSVTETTLMQQVKQYEQSNAEWRSEYYKRVAERDSWKAQANVVTLIEDARKRRDEMSTAILRLTSGNCGENSADCDLIPVAQRRLKAFEQDRDNAQRQLIELQGKLLCRQ